LVEIKKVVWTDVFERQVRKIRDNALKNRLWKKTQEILENPEIGKPLRFELKGERSIRIAPYRLIYAAVGDTLYFLRVEHRKAVYR
jgi:mRNA-degrading endonuclease RelE of RelBE toxin-antitoxin system